MIMTFELDEKIHKEISKYAEDRGLTEEEVCRWVIGQAMFGMRPVMPAFLSPFGSSSHDKEMDSLNKASMNIARMFMKSGAANGDYKCPECTQPMAFEDIEKGICGKCHKKI